MASNDMDQNGSSPNYLAGIVAGGAAGAGGHYGAKRYEQSRLIPAGAYHDALDGLIQKEADALKTATEKHIEEERTKYVNEGREKVAKERNKTLEGDELKNVDNDHVTKYNQQHETAHRETFVKEQTEKGLTPLTESHKKSNDLAAQRDKVDAQILKKNTDSLDQFIEKADKAKADDLKALQTQLSKNISGKDATAVMQHADATLKHAQNAVSKASEDLKDPNAKEAFDKMAKEHLLDPLQKLRDDKVALHVIGQDAHKSIDLLSAIRESGKGMGKLGRIGIPVGAALAVGGATATLLASRNSNESAGRSV